MSESVAELFARARELDADGRSRLLGDLAAADPERARRLAALLAAADAADSPLDADPWEKLAVDPAEVETALPERIGPYRIVAELGRGGMGRVYLGLQQGEGFSRRLAVKVVAPEGDRPDIERRFARERRILASLEHAGIARFHDAGRDESGRWYLALEYVEGVNLLEHARRLALSNRERLRLLLEVLEAVAYAHSRSVVHLDLKPSNILVGADGHPRLLDFGIAKLLDAEPAPAATRTETVARALTPAYASPEQLRGETASPASDIFSLGVVLYELLAGVHPFRGGDESRAALERQILETEPEPPSTASRRAAREERRPAPPGGRLARDLDAICMKALRKLATDRYASVAAFAADLEHHLAGRPIAARADARRFRLGRLLNRRRLALAAGAALLLALGAGAPLVVRQLAGSGRGELPEPAARPFPFSGIRGGDVEALEAAFVAAPADVAAGVRLALALEAAGRNDEAGLIVARLRQIPGHAEDPLVDYVEATLASSSQEPQHALVLYGRALDRALADGRGELVAQVRAARGRLLYLLGRRDEARRDMEAARGDFERAGDPASLARVLNDLAIEPLVAGRLAEGERLLEQALAASRAAGGGGAGIISANLGLVALQRGFPDRAERRLRETVAALAAGKSRNLGRAHAALATALLELGRRAEAERELEAAIALLREADVEHGLAEALWTRGELERERGELERAAVTAAELEARARQSGSRSALGLAQRLHGEIAAARGDLPAARRRLDAARQLLEGSGEGDWSEELDVAWATLELEHGDRAAAREIALRVRPDLRAAIEKTTQFLAEAVLAWLDAAEGRADVAERRLAALEQAAAGSTSRRRLEALARSREAVAGPPRTSAAAGLHQGSGHAAERR